MKLSLLCALLLASAVAMAQEDAPAAAEADYELVEVTDDVLPAVEGSGTARALEDPEEEHEDHEGHEDGEEYQGQEDSEEQEYQGQEDSEEQEAGEEDLDGANSYYRRSVYHARPRYYHRRFYKPVHYHQPYVFPSYRPYPRPYYHGGQRPYYTRW